MDDSVTVLVRPRDSAIDLVSLPNGGGLVHLKAPDAQAAICGYRPRWRREGQLLMPLSGRNEIYLAHVCERCAIAVLGGQHAWTLYRRPAGTL